MKASRENARAGEQKAFRNPVSDLRKKNDCFRSGRSVSYHRRKINPTGKKKLQAQLREGSFEMVTRFAEEQEAGGASVLDVNMGMSGIDEKEMMLRALEEVGGVSQLPLSLDSSHVEVLEAALRRYPGRALINSISLKRKNLRS